MKGMARIKIARGLLHINGFMKNVIEKGIFDVKLKQGPFMRHGEREDNTNCGGFDYRAEGVRVIKTKKLSVALCNEACFEALNGSIGKKFSPKNPFGTDNINIGGPRDKIPSMICLKRLYLTIHVRKPSWVFGS